MSENRMTSCFWPKQSILERLMGSSQEGNKLLMESYFFHVMLIISKKKYFVVLNTLWNKQWKIISFFTVQSIFLAGTLSNLFLSVWYWYLNAMVLYYCFSFFFFFLVAICSVVCLSCFKRSQRVHLCFLDCLSKKLWSAELSSADRKSKAFHISSWITRQ